MIQSLSGDRIRNLLSPEIRDIEIIIFRETDSTSTRARELVKERPDGSFLVVSESQTGGRGTKGRKFFSPGGGIYFTLVLSPLPNERILKVLTPIAAVAASEATDLISRGKSSIKWVNDITVGGKKACGILCEASVREEEAGFALIGVGADIYPPENGFPEEIKDTAVSICDNSDEWKREEFTAGFLNSFFELANFGEDLYNRYLNRLDLIGKNIKVIKKDGTLNARAVGLNKDFTLEVEYDDGSRESLLSDEVSIRT